MIPDYSRNSNNEVSNQTILDRKNTNINNYKINLREHVTFFRLMVDFSRLIKFPYITKYKLTSRKSSWQLLTLTVKQVTNEDNQYCTPILDQILFL